MFPINKDSKPLDQLEPLAYVTAVHQLRGDVITVEHHGGAGGLVVGGSRVAFLVFVLLASPHTNTLVRDALPLAAFLDDAALVAVGAEQRATVVIRLTAAACLHVN